MHITIKDAEKVPGLTVRVNDAGGVEIDASAVKATTGDAPTLEGVRAKLLRAADGISEHFFTRDHHMEMEHITVAATLYAALATKP